MTVKASLQLEVAIVAQLMTSLIPQVVLVYEYSPNI